MVCTEWPKCLSAAAWVKVPCGAQIGGLQRLLQGQAGGHDLAEEPRDLLAVQGTRVALLDPPQDRRLPLRAVELDALRRSRRRAAWRS